ncbi:MAG: M24 family metallopeptidase, partial [Desulfuromonadaceae bacterium]|nr:M24 family metallopeptidase [Desulfuromonadaceae bacterium]
SIEAIEPVIIDFAGCVDGYLIDQTRVFSVGEPSDHLRRAYDDMLEIQALMMRTIEVGMTWGELYEVCFKCAADMGYAESFMGAKGAQVSFIGHGLGIEMDEYPFIARNFTHMTFEAGMAFAFEPKVVFPGEGSVGIENTFYLSNEGLKRLTHSDDGLVILN